MFKKYILPHLIWFVYKLWSWSWRLEIHESEELQLKLIKNEPVIFAHWHGDELVLLNLIGHYRVATIASKSQDGELMNKLIKKVGGITSRGSSTRGGVEALKGLIRLVKNTGRNTSFAVDGPKGPLHKVKPGVFEFSRLLGCPIFAGGVWTSKALFFKKSWNQTFIPYPFARVVLVWTGPLGPITKGQNPRDSDLAKSLENQLHDAKQLAAKYCEV